MFERLVDMLIKHLINVYDLLDRADASGAIVKEYKESLGANNILIKRLSDIESDRYTDYVRIQINGRNGKSSGGNAPTIGILGRLGGIGARPDVLGYVSDGDGALAALTVASKLLEMQNWGDYLEGDVIVCTDINPEAPTQPHDPVPFMGSAVSMDTINAAEVSSEMDAILCIDTTKGNRIINHKGFAISPTVKDGYILRVSDSLLDIYQIVTGELPHVFAITQQDITPYGNELYHLNSIMQPCTVTEVPVVGVAITAETMVPGCATGASHFEDIEAAARFSLEVAKEFGAGKCSFFDSCEYEKIVHKYGSMSHFRTKGKI